MKWFRSNIKHGSRLALLALAVQFLVSSGHFHWDAARAASAIQPDTPPLELPLTALNANAELTQPQPASNPEPERRPSDPCAICAVMALANTAVFAAPPVLLLPQAVEFLYLATDAEFIHLKSVRVAFQPRGPPAS
jgi:hypothetical protein